MVLLFSEICFHECLFPETELEREVLVYSGYLFAFLPPSCIQDPPQVPWRDCDASSHVPFPPFCLHLICFYQTLPLA